MNDHLNVYDRPFNHVNVVFKTVFFFRFLLISQYLTGNQFKCDVFPRDRD